MTVDPDDQMKEESQLKTWGDVVEAYNEYFIKTEKRIKALEDWAGESFREWSARQEK